MTTARKVVLMLVILAAVLVTVPSAVAGFDVPNNGDWEYTDDVSSPAEQVEDIYIEEKEETVLFGADIEGNSQEGLDSDTLQVYIDTDQGETGKQESSSEFYAGLEPIRADYRVSVSDGGLPIIQKYNEEDKLYEFIKGIEYKEKNDIAVVEVEKATIDNPEAFDVKFAHVYGDVGDDTNYDWLPDSDIESYQVSDENTGINERKSATINVNPTFAESLDDASVEIVLTDDNGETVGTKTRENVNTDDLTVSFTVDPDNFNNNGDASAEVIVEGDEEFVVNEDIDNTAAIDQELSDSDEETISDGLEFSHIESDVEFRSSDNPDSVTFTLEDDDGTVRNRENTTGANSVSEIFTVNENNFDNGDGTLSVTVEGDRPYPDQSLDVTSIVDAPDIDFDLSNVPHGFAVENPGVSTLDVGGSPPDDGFSVDVSVDSGVSGSNIGSVTHVIEFDERIDEEQVNVDFKSPFDDGNQYYTEHTVGEGEIEITMYSIDDSEQIVSGGGNTETVASIEFNLENVETIKENIDQGDQNSEPLTLNTVTEDSEMRDTSGNQLSYSSSDANVDIKNSQTRLTGAEVTHLTDDGDMVGAPIKIDVEVETNDGELDKIELLDGSGNDITGSNTEINCGDESTCGEDETLEYTPGSSTGLASGGYGAKGHQIEVTTKSGDTFKLSEEFDSIEDSDIETVVYAKGDVNRDGPSKYKTVRKSDVNTVIENRGEEAGGLPWNDAELARADINNDGTIDINDITSIISVYDPAEGTVEFSNDPLDVDNDQVDIEISGLNDNINKNVDVVVVNNDEDETDITTGGNSDLTGGTAQSIDIDTTNVDPNDELEVQIHEVNDPTPDAAGGNPVDTDTENVESTPTVQSATVEDGSPSEVVVSFDESVEVDGTVGDASTVFTFDPDETLTNDPVAVDSASLTANGDGDIVVPLDSAVDASDADSLTNALDYDDTDADIIDDTDGTAAAGFTGQEVTNSVNP